MVFGFFGCNQQRAVHFNTVVKGFFIFLFAPTFSFVAQDSVSVAEVFMACGNKYFSDNETSQPAMVVRGKFCGNMYYWTPPVMGDSLTQQAFRNDLPFSEELLISILMEI